MSRAPGRLRNIGPRGCRRRTTTGAVALAAGVVGLGVLWTLDVERGWRLLLFLPFWLGALGLTQARRHT